MSGAWNPEKVAVFRDSFYEFLEHVVISSKEKGRMVLADNLYRAQVMFYETIFDGLKEDCHEFLFLKSRQLGISTGTRPLSLFWLGMHEGLRGAMVFDSSFNTAAARREIEETIDNLPKRLHFPRIKTRNRDALILENDSWLMFMQAGTRNSRAGGGLGRSLGLNFCHCSEISSWANEEGVVSFRQSLATDWPDRLYIWESTARGYELWYKMWQEAKSDPYTKRTCFIGWWAKDNQIIPKDAPKYTMYGADPPNKKEKERIKAVAEQYEWDITPEQLAWYRWKTDPARDLDEEDPEDSVVVQEQPWLEAEAFQATGSDFFQADKLAAAIGRLTYARRPQTFKFWPGTDFVTCDIRTARTRRETEFRMWEEPASDSWYVIAADPAFGHDEANNNSAAQVMRCYADAIDQVGEYASATIQPHQFAWLLWTLVGYYGSKPNSQVMMICELNGPGEEVWRQYNATPMIVRNGYLRIAAQERGIQNIFQNARNYIYSRSDAMQAGHNYQFKCLAIDTPLPSPCGWVLMEDVAVGDQLFDERGELCNVTAISDIKYGRQCLKITFDDRSSIVCDQEHFWKTTDGLVRAASELRAGVHSIWATAPLELPAVQLPIDPYMLGLWLGDGASAAGCLYGHRDDINEISRHIRDVGYEVREPTTDGHGGNVYRISVVGLTSLLRDIGVLGNKHIPAVYLRASKEQRAALLQGLMDTDGTIGLRSGAQAAFVTSSSALASGFAELIRSLGIKSKYLTKIPTYDYEGEKKEGKIAYQFAFTTYEDFPVFRLTRKLEIQIRGIGGIVRSGKGGPGKRRRKRSRAHHIVEIAPVNSVPVKCVAVDSPSRLYLAGEAMVPTHNTNSQLKVAIMEATRNYLHNGILTVNSIEALEEMRTITRDGDKIGAENRNRDDRTFSIALGVRAWDEKIRRSMIAGNRTKEAERAKLSVSIEDQATLWNRNTLTSFLKVKEAARTAQRVQASRAGWRQGGRRTMTRPW